MLKYIGDFSQLFGIKEYTLSGGKTKGVKAFDVRNGSGLEITVLSDRCLDIAGAKTGSKKSIWIFKYKHKNKMFYLSSINMN